MNEKEDDLHLTSYESPVVETRRPNPSLLGQNGFETHEAAVDDEGENEEITGSDVEGLGDAQEKYFLATRILTGKERPMLSLNEMKESNLRADTPFGIEDRIAALGKEYLSDLQLIYDAHALEYHEEQRHRYSSYPEKYEDMNIDEKTDPNALDTHQALEHLYTSTREPENPTDHLRDPLFIQTPNFFFPKWQNEIEQAQYEYTSNLISLRSKLAEARKSWDLLFPSSPQEFHWKSLEMQLKVAKFLMADLRKQERMLSEFGWDLSQVGPLKEAYLKNDKFQSEIMAMLIS